jgi:imidazole glycerol phosphate synthase subunit HisF
MANRHVALAKMKATQAAGAMRRRVQATQMEHKLIRQGAGLLTGAVLGSMQLKGIENGFNRNEKDPESQGIPWKPLVGTIAFIGSAFTKGTVSAALEGISIGANAVYTARAIETKSIVAGI